MRLLFIMTQPESRFSSASLRNFFSPIRKYFDAYSIVKVYFSQIGTSVLFIECITPFYVRSSEVDRWLW
ncbi:Putative extrachromosomal origin protein [Clostridioides difficile E28]|uniref:Extrachromosomal origin protein n=1 Tax=Clostridioides difficile (strain 630) TaxID=272563 RepID=F3Y5Z6_CLOD6|nr:putative extrachromosomal origin protein [Clostridioides difficile 630]CCL69209.1 Putative extrachromosomal origin protein [Clostridioides difficile T3]CCL72846.1 Putative extrachromosomal origin protein [Clostridioides difficile E28]CCL80453.1 Putative extrachromosomal origin protein [Clostridioides difficile E12]CCL91728.1 Putative extrachromosomal origin protein [Clostridioides difficile T14]CEJ98834.1 putative extrachromosomal origin protein [Clostridioides difficile]